MRSDSKELRESVRKAYSQAAARPEEKHPFPVGEAFALSLGYPREVLSKLPSAATGGFAGVSNVSIFAAHHDGATVVDLGCGSGMDAMIAAQRVGQTGRVIGIDFSEEMLERASAAKRALGTEQLTLIRSAAESLPLADGCADCVQVNGIFNLNPFREQIFQELARVLKPGGKVYGAELILRAPLPEELRGGSANWFS